MIPKAKRLPSLLLTLLLMLLLSPAAYADTDANTPHITQQPDQLILQLGARWAGVEFELRTDAGVFPVPVVVDESGILSVELGGSSTYTLSCIDSSIPIPDPEPVDPETQSPGSNAPSAPAQSPGSNAPAGNTRSIAPIVFFIAALALAVVGLVALLLSRRRSYSRYGNWDDEDDF